MYTMLSFIITLNWFSDQNAQGDVDLFFQHASFGLNKLIIANIKCHECPSHQAK